jgi:hypothetical protein
MYKFPSPRAGVKDRPRPEGQPPSSRGSAAPLSRWWVEVGQPSSQWGLSVQPPSTVRRAAQM